MMIGQDVHFTNNRFAPLQFNPAQTGDFEGNIRVGAMFRRQFSDFIFKPYQSLMLYGDLNINSPLRKNDWISVGLQIFNDRAGDLDLGYNSYQASAAYHLALDKQYNQVISLGLAYLHQRRTINISNAIFPNSLISGSPDLDKNALTDFRGGTSDFNIGLGYTLKVQKTGYFKAGVALLYLKGLDVVYIRDSVNIENGRRWNANLNYMLPLADKKTHIEMATYLSLLRNFQNISFQIIGHRLMNTDKQNPLIVNFGLGYRMNDALQFLTGARYQRWSLGIAYDLTVSSASLYNQYNGAIELSLARIINFDRTPKVKPVFFCPKL